MIGIPETCRAALLVGRGQPLEIREVPVPGRIEPHAILVRHLVATICATDGHVQHGDTQASHDRYPRILGHEMVGRVVRLGEGVTHDSIGRPLAVGDRIVYTHGFCGQCYQCVVAHEPTLCEHRRGYTQTLSTEFPHLTGGFAEYGYVFPTAGRVRVPDIVPDELASAASCALRTVVHGFDRLGRIRDTDRVAIQGSGPLGLFATALAVRSGAPAVIVIGGPAERLAVARRWGATHTLDIGELPDPSERRTRILDWTEGRGPEVVIEVSGARSAFPEGIDLIARGGRYLVLGQRHNEAVEVRPSDITGKHLRVVGSISAGVDHYARALDFLAHNWERFPWMDLISNRYRLEEINVALERMREWREIKAAIVLDEQRD